MIKWQNELNTSAFYHNFGAYEIVKLKILCQKGESHRTEHIALDVGLVYLLAVCRLYKKEEERTLNRTLEETEKTDIKLEL